MAKVSFESGVWNWDEVMHSESDGDDDDADELLSEIWHDSDSDI